MATPTPKRRKMASSLEKRRILDGILMRTRMSAHVARHTRPSCAYVRGTHTLALRAYTYTPTLAGTLCVMHDARRGRE